MNNSDYYQAHLDFPTDVVESEFECLNLFIVRPSPAALTRIGCDVSGSGIPVFVWIHGGGYGFGASTDPIWGMRPFPSSRSLLEARICKIQADLAFNELTDPTRLVMRSISFRTPFIAVCLNYRLNIFGFAASSNILNTQSESQFKGCNFGLRDQKVALTWISQNISSFGGDPRNITLGGQSAGASSVHVHTLEAKLKHERPLFRRAIIQSGAIGCLGPISLETANTHWEELCQKLGLQNKDEVTRMRHLRSMTAADLLYASRSLSWITFPVVIDNLSVADTTLDCKVKVDFGDVNEVALVTEDTDDGSIAILIGDTDAEVCGNQSPILKFPLPGICIVKLTLLLVCGKGKHFFSSD
jgi:carboxylesterase type B